MTEPVLTGRAAERITERLDELDQLQRADESPWANHYGKPLDSRRLAKLLRGYGVRSKVIRVGDSTPRGYEQADMAGAWGRYLPQQAQQRNSAGQVMLPRCAVADGSATAQHAQASDQERCTVADVADTSPEDPVCDRCGERHHRYGDGGRPCKAASG